VQRTEFSLNFVLINLNHTPKLENLPNIFLLTELPTKSGVKHAKEI